MRCEPDLCRGFAYGKGCIRQPSLKQSVISQRYTSAATGTAADACRRACSNSSISPAVQACTWEKVAVHHVNVLMLQCQNKINDFWVLCINNMSFSHCACGCGQWDTLEERLYTTAWNVCGQPFNQCTVTLCVLWHLCIVQWLCILKDSQRLPILRYQISESLRSFILPVCPQKSLCAIPNDSCNFILFNAVLAVSEAAG